MLKRNNTDKMLEIFHQLEFLGQYLIDTDPYWWKYVRAPRIRKSNFALVQNVLEKERKQLLCNCYWIIFQIKMYVILKEYN